MQDSSTTYKKQGYNISKISIFNYFPDIKLFNNEQSNIVEFNRFVIVI